MDEGHTHLDTFTFLIVGLFIIGYNTAVYLEITQHLVAGSV